MEKEIADYDLEIQNLHTQTNNMEVLYVIEFDSLKQQTAQLYNELIDNFI